MFGMSAVYGTASGFSVAQISLFIGTIYMGSLIVQYPIGWLSDRMDRRLLIVYITSLAAAILLTGLFWAESFYVTLALGFVLGGSTSPLYALLIAHTNDYLEHEDMANASGTLVFIGGLGAIGMPVFVGYTMTSFGPNSFFYTMITLMLMVSAYGIYRMTRRESISVEETTPYTPILPQSTPIVAEVAQEIAIEREIEASD